MTRFKPQTQTQTDVTRQRNEVNHRDVIQRALNSNRRLPFSTHIVHEFSRSIRLSGGVNNIQRSNQRVNIYDSYFSVRAEATLVLQTPCILCETQRRLVIVSLALYMYMYINCVQRRRLRSKSAARDKPRCGVALVNTETKYVITPLHRSSFNCPAVSVLHPVADRHLSGCP